MINLNELHDQLEQFKHKSLTGTESEKLAYERIQAWIRLTVNEQLEEYYQAWLAGHPDTHNLILDKGNK